MRKVSLFLALVGFSWAGPSSPAAGEDPAGEVVVQGPRDLQGDLVTATGSTPCTPVAKQEVFQLRCSTAPAGQWVFTRSGYESRSVPLPLSPCPPLLDLNDGEWRPTPVALALAPAELAGHAIVVWSEAKELHLLEGAGGPLRGPRVAPGEKFVVAVVGVGVAAVIREGVRDPAAEPVTITLAEGSSRVVVCRDPWSGEVLEGCVAVAGKKPRLLVDRGQGRLEQRKAGKPAGPLQVLDGLGDDFIVSVQAPGLPPLLLSDPRQPVMDTVMPLPRTLRVTLEHGKTGRRVAGQVWLVGPFKVFLEEKAADHRGVTEWQLGDGEYEVFAAAEGFGPVRESVRIEQRNVDLALKLSPAVKISGWVVDEAGQPIPQAAVLAWPGATFNTARASGSSTDAAGRFSLDLHGDPPWTVTAQAEEFASTSVTVAQPDHPLTLQLRRQCEVTLVVMNSDGTALGAEVVMALRLQTLEAVRLQGRGGGVYGATLSPGQWLLVSEAHKASASVVVPEACQHWTGHVTLAPGLRIPRPNP